MKKTLTTITLRAIALALCLTASANVYADGTINVGSPAHEPKNGWIFAGDSIVIIRNGNYTVTGSTATNRIVTADSVTATVTLANADITSSVNSPFRLSENGTKGSDVTLILTGANRLVVDSIVTLMGANKDSVDYSKPYSVGYAGLTVEGKARLTIRTADGNDRSGNLTAQGAGIGLNIQGEVAGAGIGAGAWTLNGRKGAGDITINSGTIVATGGEGGAGIGGGTVFESATIRNGGNVVINGGAITANGGIYGAGIGAGAFGGGGSVTINGGVIAANGGTGGPAIGSGAGAKEDAGIITIHGGMVRAYGGVYATGIGGGYESAGGIITISGGTIVAHTCGATDDPAGIGGSGEAGIIRISGGTVLATGGTGPGIGGGHGKNGGSISITGGIVIADQIGVGHHGRTATTISGSQTVVLSPQINGITAGGIYGGATVLTDSAVVVDDYTGNMILNADLTLPSGVTLFVPKGRTFTNNGAITNYGAIINRDTIFNYGTITDDGLVINKGIFIGNRITTADLLSMSGWKYGEAPKSAVLRVGKHDGAASVIEYKRKNAPDNAYTSAVPKDAGDYTVREKYAGSQVYNDLLLTADFAIDKIPLMVTADDKSRAYGEANPAFTLTYSGFVNGETESVLTAAPVAQTSANATSPAGTYAIIPSGGEAANYIFKYVAGTLTITPATPAPNPLHLVRFCALLDDSVKQYVEFTPAADTVMRKREGDAILFVIKVKDGVQLTAPELFINNSKTTLFRNSRNSWFLAIVVGKEDVDIAVMGLRRIPAGVEEAVSAVLHAVPTDNGLMLTGLVPGDMFGVYNMQGQLFYKGKATSGKERIPLRNKGVYIVVAGDRTVKAVY